MRSPPAPGHFPALGGKAVFHGVGDKVVTDERGGQKGDAPHQDTAIRRGKIHRQSIQRRKNSRLQPPDAVGGEEALFYPCGPSCPDAPVPVGEKFCRFIKNNTYIEKQVEPKDRTVFSSEEKVLVRPIAKKQA